jgi:death on curing protein
VSEEIVFLTVEQVLALHGALTKRFGGDPTVLSLDLLESAVMMPQARFGGQALHESVGAVAAAYLFHICQNHAFADGNKRIALAAAGVFLFLNGKRVRATGRELERLTRRVAERKAPKGEVVRFLEERTA